MGRYVGAAAVAGVRGWWGAGRGFGVVPGMVSAILGDTKPNQSGAWHLLAREDFNKGGEPPPLRSLPRLGLLSLPVFGPDGVLWISSNLRVI